MLVDAQWVSLEPLIEACRPQGQDPAPGSAAHDLGDRLATSERSQVARHPR